MTTPTRHRAVTLIELMVCLIFVSLGYVGVTRAISHSLRISERAQVRSELSAAAQAELDRLRTQPAHRADFVHLLPGGRIRLRVTSGDGPEGLLAHTVVAEAIGTQPPFTVELTGWVVAP